MDEPRGDDGQGARPARLRRPRRRAGRAASWPRRGASLGSEVTLVEARRPRCSAARSRSPPRRSSEALRDGGVDVRTGVAAPTRGRARRRRRSTLDARRRRARSRATSCCSRSAATPRTERHRPGDRRPRAGRADRDRRPPARPGAAVAVRDRRRQRPRAAHPPGQVPGPHRRRPHPRRVERRASSTAARCRRASCSPSRRSPRSATRSRRAQEAGHRRARAVDADVNEHRGRELLRPRRAGHARGSSSTRTAASLVGATFTGAEVGDFLHAATIAIVGDVPLDRLWHAVPCFPTPQRGLAQAARELRPVRR